MRVAILLSIALGGCAVSTQGVQREAVAETYVSTKQPLVVARCMKAAFPALDVEPGEREISVSHRNPFGSILQNWLVRETPSGSAIDYRRTGGFAADQAKVAACF